jgi:hypothetical protein
MKSRPFRAIEEQKPAIVVGSLPVSVNGTLRPGNRQLGFDAGDEAGLAWWGPTRYRVRHWRPGGRSLVG